MIKCISSILFIFLISTSSFAKYEDSTNNVLHESLSSSTISSSEKEVKFVVKEILKVVGLKSNIEIKADTVEAVESQIRGDKRYILFNPSFMTRINAATGTDWAAVCILAHEIGHHLNGHTLSMEGDIPTRELEADEFAGFVLRKMGASLSETQAVIKLLCEENDSPSHPAKRKRLASIKSGWMRADKQITSLE